jgi:ABC-type nitrate/sulfonate/bicarbonate transport system substrate-binding protein
MDRLVFPVATHNYFHAPLWLAQHYGLFAAQGLDVVTEYTDQGTDELTSMVSDGRAQIGTSTTERVIINREAGGNLVVIGGKVNRLPFSLIARPSIKSFEDLRGKTIGVSSLDNGTSTVITRLCESHGLHHPSDFTLRAVGPIEKRWEMLRSGEIDAGLQGVPLDLIAMDAGFTNLAAPSKIFAEYQFSSFVADARWAKANRDIVVRFMRAILQGFAMFYANRERTVPVVMLEAGISRDYAIRAWEIYSAARIFPPDGDVTMAGMRAMIELSATVRNLAKRLGTRLEDCIDRSYLIAARDTLPAFLV